MNDFVLYVQPVFDLLIAKTVITKSNGKRETHIVT